MLIHSSPSGGVPGVKPLARHDARTLADPFPRYPACMESTSMIRSRGERAVNRWAASRTLATASSSSRRFVGGGDGGGLGDVPGVADAGRAAALVMIPLLRG